jgi:hypothetical protein
MSDQKGAPPQQHVREVVGDSARNAAEIASLGAEVFTVWADVGQRALHGMLELSSRAAQESARQLAEWQQANVDVLREWQAAAFRWPTLWPEMLRDPIRGYQRMVEEGIESSQRAFALTRRNAETMTGACQRLERAADEATRTLGQTFSDASTRMQDVYARSDRLRAA